MSEAFEDMEGIDLSQFDEYKTDSTTGSWALVATPIFRLPISGMQIEAAVPPAGTSVPVQLSDGIAFGILHAVTARWMYLYFPGVATADIDALNKDVVDTDEPATWKPAEDV